MAARALESCWDGSDTFASAQALVELAPMRDNDNISNYVYTVHIGYSAQGGTTKKLAL